MKILLFLIIFFLISRLSIAVETPARNISVNTSYFSKNLNSTDTDVQTSLNTIDKINTITSSPAQCNAGYFPLGIDTSGNAIGCTQAGSANSITALTGDVTATGPGSVTAFLATVNPNSGSFTNANITVNGKGLITAASNGSSGGVSSVSNSDGSLTISPTTGSVIGSLNVGHSNTWTGLQNFTVSNVGINSANPGQILDVNGTSRMTGFTLSGNNATTGYVLTATDSSGDANWQASSGGSSSTNYVDLYMRM